MEVSMKAVKVGNATNEPQGTYLRLL